MPPLELILDAADMATRTAMKRDSRWHQEDWEDAHSEALLGVLQAANRTSDAGFGYCFRAGLHRIYRWMRDECGWLNGDRPFQIDEYANTLIVQDKLVAEDTTMSRAMLAYLDRLPPLLAKQQSGKKPIQVGRQIEYLRLTLEGYSRDGIALELGVSVDNVHGIRKRLLPRLRTIAANH